MNWMYICNLNIYLTICSLQKVFFAIQIFPTKARALFYCLSKIRITTVIKIFHPQQHNPRCQDEIQDRITEIETTDDLTEVLATETVEICVMYVIFVTAETEEIIDAKTEIYWSVTQLK